MSRLSFIAVLLMYVACGGSSTVITGTGGGSGTGGGASGGRAGGAGGSAGSTGGGTAGMGGSGGGDPSGCPDDAKTVYVVALDRTFSAFDPRTKTFRDIGTLACPAAGGAGPFSMSISRDAFAYVLYDDGELFKVSTADLSCTPTGFTPGTTYKVFGMGFSTDAAGGTTDSLFIAGGQSVVPMSKLGRLDVGSFAPTPLVDLPGWPELTGTGDAKLWGFFPDQPGGGSTPFVARIEKTTGALSSSFPAPSLAGSPNSWAFAFWGGSFWIFLKRDSDGSTNVYEMKAADGGVSPALMNTGRTIVGAGVSTCAPLVIN
jgi:hypothetical protein